MTAEKLAVQLYTLRDFTKTALGFREALEKVAAIGYKGVQVSAVGALESEVSPEQAKGWLDELGVKCVATHRSWDALRNRTQEEIEFHKVLDCDYVALGWLDGYEHTPAAYRQFLSDASSVIEQLKAAGIRFGMHNHAHEFVKFDGVQPYAVFLDEGGKNLYLEIDTYWVSHAGIDPSTLLEKGSGRIPMIHVKDVEMTAKGPIMGAIGEGNMDWARIVATAEKGGTEWYIVEQDVCPRDPFDCLRSSFEFLSTLAI